MCKFGDAKRKQALSQVKVKVQPGGDVAQLHYAQGTDAVPVLLSAKSLTALGAIINFEIGHAVFRNLEPENVAQLERRPTGHLWMELFEQLPVVNDNPLSSLGQAKHVANVGLMSRNSQAHVLVAQKDSCTDSQRASPSRQTRESDTPDTTTMRCSRVHSEKTVSLKSPFGVRENRSHVARLRDDTKGRRTSGCVPTTDSTASGRC